jgi:outer membrane biosynthesis protein TonB
MKGMNIVLVLVFLLAALFMWGCAAPATPETAEPEVQESEAVVENTEVVPDTPETEEQQPVEDSEEQETAEEPAEIEEAAASEDETADEDDTSEDEEVAASAGDDSCLDCHTDKERLTETADPVEDTESESEGAG